VDWYQVHGLASALVAMARNTKEHRVQRYEDDYWLGAVIAIYCWAS
jgi:hypothetical protein